MIWQLKANRDTSPARGLFGDEREGEARWYWVDVGRIEFLCNRVNRWIEK